MKRCVFALLVLFCVPALSQTSAVGGWCEQGAKAATVSGLNSTNKLQGIIPGCTVTVYYTDTSTQVPGSSIFADSIGTVLGNPFTANTATGQYLFYAATGVGLDVVRSSGTTQTDVIPGGGGGGGGSGTVNPGTTGQAAVYPGNGSTVQGGTLGTAGGGTGATTASGALTNLGAAGLATTNQFTGQNSFENASPVFFNGGGANMQGESASAGSNVNSEPLIWQGNYYNVTSLPDYWTATDVLGSGSSPTSTLTFTQSGSAGNVMVSMPALTLTGLSPSSSALCNNGTGNTITNVGCGSAATLPALPGGTMWAASGAPGSTSTTPVESFATHSPSQIVNDACPTNHSPLWHLNAGICVSGPPTDNYAVLAAIGASGRSWVFPTNCDGKLGDIYSSTRVDITVDNTQIHGGSVGSPTSLTNGCRTTFYFGDITHGGFRVRGVNHVHFTDFNLTCPATATPATTGCQAGTIGIDGANIDGTHTVFSGDDLEMINVGIDGFSQVINWWGYQNYIIDTTANSYPGENNPNVPAAVIGGTTPNEGRIRNFMVHCGTINTGHQTASSAIQMQNGGFGGDFHVGDNVGACAGTGGVYNLGAFGGNFYPGDTEAHTGPQMVMNGPNAWTYFVTNYTNPQNSTGPDILTSGAGSQLNLIGSVPTLPNATNYPVFTISHTAASTTCAAGNRFYTMQNNNPRGSAPQSPEQLVTISAGDSVTLTWTQLWGVQYYTVNEGATTGSELVEPIKLQGSTVTWTDNCTLTPSGSPPAGGTMRYAEIGMIAEKDNIQALIAANDGSGATSGDVNYMGSSPTGEYFLLTPLRTLDEGGSCPSAVWANRGMITRGLGQVSTGSSDVLCYSYWNGSSYTSTNLLSFLTYLKASTSLNDNTTGTVLYIAQTGVGTANPLIDLLSSNGSGVDYPLRVTNTNSGGSLIRGYTTGSAYVFSLGVTSTFFNTTTSVNPAAGAVATLSTPVNSNNFFLYALAWCGAGASTTVDLKMRVLPTAGLNQPISYYFNPDLGACTGLPNVNFSQFAGGMYVPDSFLMTAGFNAATKALPTCNNSTGALGGIYGVNDATSVTAGAVYSGGGTGVTHVHCTVLSSVYNWYVM